jgi:hypothetical protein
VKIGISAINKFYRTSAINGIIGFIEILSPIKFSLHRRHRRYQRRQVDHDAAMDGRQIPAGTGAATPSTSDCGEFAILSPWKLEPLGSSP